MTSKSFIYLVDKPTQRRTPSAILPTTFCLTQGHVHVINMQRGLKKFTKCQWTGLYSIPHQWAPPHTPSLQTLAGVVEGQWVLVARVQAPAQGWAPSWGTFGRICLVWGNLCKKERKKTTGLNHNNKQQLWKCDLSGYMSQHSIQIISKFHASTL